MREAEWKRQEQERLERERIAEQERLELEERIANMTAEERTAYFEAEWEAMQNIIQAEREAGRERERKIADIDYDAARKKANL